MGISRVGVCAGPFAILGYWRVWLGTQVGVITGGFMVCLQYTRMNQLLCRYLLCTMLACEDYS